MSDTQQEYHPSVDYSFIYNLIDTCDKIEDKIEVSSTTAFILIGNSPSNKRTLYLRKTIDLQVPFLKASSICLRLSKMGELLEWYESNRGWKDGEFFEQK